ncbi:putative L-gulono-1,4-lactone dehydrogenase-like [Capsicum annuum]|nr:putative L-gulono-1,4-lactone dehydrogenase-like [Capsicum annuum]
MYLPPVPIRVVYFNTVRLSITTMSNGYWRWADGEVVACFYCHGIELGDDDKKLDETSVAMSGKRLEPLHRATEYRLVTTSDQELKMELAAGYSKSMTWLCSQQQQPLQLCLACKCCMSATAKLDTCTSMPCCFVIDRQLSNKPYGVCASVQYKSFKTENVKLKDVMRRHQDVSGGYIYRWLRRLGLVSSPLRLV